MNIVFVAHSSFNENFVVGSHHLSRAMAAEGHTVWHIGPSVTPFHVFAGRNFIVPAAAAALAFGRRWKRAA